MILGILPRYKHKLIQSQQKKIETILKSPKSSLIIILINTFKKSLCIYLSIMSVYCFKLRVGVGENPYFDKICT